MGVLKDYMAKFFSNRKKQRPDIMDGMSKAEFECYINIDLKVEWEALQKRINDWETNSSDK